MNNFDYLQVITLIIFLLVFFGRSIWLRRKDTKVFVLGSGKKGFTALLEKSFLIFFPIWMIESLDREASRLGVPRQSLIKMLIARHLSEHVA